jgi:hypothetical protein
MDVGVEAGNCALKLRANLQVLDDRPVEALAGYQ